MNAFPLKTSEPHGPAETLNWQNLLWKIGHAKRREKNQRLLKLQRFNFGHLSKKIKGI
jgi:hypothetical protein